MKTHYYIYNDKRLFQSLYYTLLSQYPKDNLFIDLDKETGHFSRFSNEKDMHVIGLMLTSLFGEKNYDGVKYVVNDVQVIIPKNPYWCFCYFDITFNDCKLRYQIPLQWITQGQKWEKLKVPVAKTTKPVNPKLIKELTDHIEFWWGHLIAIRKKHDGYDKAYKLLSQRPKLVAEVDKYYNINLIASNICI